MNGSKVEELQRAIGTLTQEELEDCACGLMSTQAPARSIAASKRTWRRAAWTKPSKPRCTTRSVEESVHFRGMEHRATEAFWRAYQALPPEIQNRADKQFALLQNNPEYPSLHFKKVGESRGQEVWSARVTLNYRGCPIFRASDRLP